MRQLIILRGPQGSGRGTFSQQNDLTPWLIDQRELEPLFSDLVTNSSDAMDYDPQQRARARKKTLALVAEKASRGNLIVFKPTDTGAPSGREAISASDKMINSVIEACQRWRYQVCILDFSTRYAIDDLMARRSAMGLQNETREALLRSLRHMEKRQGLPVTGNGIAWLTPEAGAAPLLDRLEPAVINLDRYRNVVAIGDIHGCLKTLRALIGPDSSLADSCLIFLGDYINKGPDSGGVLRELLGRFVPSGNCFFLTGNHEKPLEEWSLGIEPSKRVFQHTTLPSFHRHGLLPQDAAEFLNHTMDGARFEWRGLDILATHGGFARPPRRLLTISTENLQFGAESAGFDIDAAWENNVLASHIPDSRSLVQVHGHRNPRSRPIAAGAGTFNLENGVDQGGDMRAVVFQSTPRGVTTSSLSVPCVDDTGPRSTLPSQGTKSDA